MASAGGRFFGFVVGSSLPATLAANWLAGAWDQNAGIVVLSPIAAKLEEVAMRWMLGLLGLPPECGAGFVTCATQANFAGLAAARHALLARRGWDVETQGLFGAPPITVVVSEQVHVSVLKALTLLGLGRERVISAPVDGQGRIRSDAMPRLDADTIVCLQAGDINTGAFDPAAEIIPRAKDAGAWVLVDGAFGLWAAAAPARAHLVKGFADADSWATDAHKWLNVPYDSGIVFVRDPRHLHAAMAVNAPYLVISDAREPEHYTPDFSRRARGVEVWAARRGIRYPQRRGDQSSAGLVRRCRADSPGDRRDSGGGHVLGGCDRVAGSHRHANQRLFMGDHRPGCGAQLGGDASSGGGHGCHVATSLSGHADRRVDRFARLAARVPSTLALASTARSSPGNRASTSADRSDSMRLVPSGRIRMSPAVRSRAK